MIQNRISVEAIVLGRNDEYEPNWSENLKASIAYNRARFAGTLVDYSVCFVEWNPPWDRPLLVPDLIVRFPFLRGIVVDADVHDALCESTSLKMMLNFALNCALRTSKADFCLLFAGDLFISKTIAGYVSGVGLARNCLYRAERVNIRNDLDFVSATPAMIENPKNIVSINSCTEPPYDAPPYTNACGDFILVNRLTMLGVRGYDESIRSARLHLDSRFCWTAMHAGLNCNLIGQIFHINHNKSYSVMMDDYPDLRYDADQDLPYLNPRIWGLAEYTWKQQGDRYWYVGNPSGDPAAIIPAQFSEDELDAINAVTRKIIRRRSELYIDKAKVQTLASACLEKLLTQPYWTGASVVGANPVVVETTSVPWGYSATLRLAQLRQRHENIDGPLFWEVECEVRIGDIGLGLIDHDAVIAEQSLNALGGRRMIYLPAVATDADLLVRNGPKDGKSQIAIYGVRLVKVATIGANEDLL